MPKVLVIHYTESGRLPRFTDEQKSEIQRKASEILKKYSEVKFNGSYADEDGVGICEFEAPNAEVVEKFCKELGAAPYDKVIIANKVL